MNHDWSRSRTTAGKWWFQVQVLLGGNMSPTNQRKGERKGRMFWRRKRKGWGGSRDSRRRPSVMVAVVVVVVERNAWENQAWERTCDQGYYHVLLKTSFPFRLTKGWKRKEVTQKCGIFFQRWKAVGDVRITTIAIEAWRGGKGCDQVPGIHVESLSSHGLPKITWHETWEPLKLVEWAIDTESHLKATIA